MNHKQVIRDLMSTTGTTQAQLGDLIGVRQTAISNILNRDDIHLSTYVRILAALGYELQIRATEPTDHAQA